MAESAACGTFLSYRKLRRNRGRMLRILRRTFLTLKKVVLQFVSFTGILAVDHLNQLLIPKQVVRVKNLDQIPVALPEGQRIADSRKKPSRRIFGKMLSSLPLLADLTFTPTER